MSAAGPVFERTLRAAAGLLVAGRFLTVTEAAVLSDRPDGPLADLWLAAASLAALAVCTFLAWRDGRGVRLGVCDGLVWGLALTHALATVPVFAEGGDRRAAVNVAFGWVGVAATFTLLRQVWRPGDGRRFAARPRSPRAWGPGRWGRGRRPSRCRRTGRRTGSCAAKKEELAARLAAADPARRAGRAARAELAAVRSRLAAFGAPDDPAARRRWEDRFLASTEPFGPYALANTLAGVLLAAAVACGAFLGGDRRARVAAAVAGAGLVAVLVLTKSRTGWVGLAAGVAVWSLARWAGGTDTAGGRRAGAVRSSGAVGRIGRAASVALAVFGVTVGGLFATGVLDREVLSEAPKSLEYRLQYWTGALRALADRPLLGTGPANFRPFYLLHKSPAASEAVAAPHNLALDLWASGGLLAPLLAAALAWCGVKQWRAGGVSPLSGADPTPPAEATPPQFDPLFIGVLLAFPLVGGAGLLIGGGNLPVVFAGLPAAAALRFLRDGGGGAGRGTGAVWAGVAVGLATHLLGADGVQFPAVLCVFALALAAAPPPRDRGRRAAGAAGAVAAAAGALAAAGMWFVVVPAQTAGALLDAAAADAAAGRDPRGALVRAGQADPLSDAPLAARAESATARFLANPADPAARRRAGALWADYAARRPRDLRPWARLSQIARAADDRPAAAAADAAVAARDPSAAAPRADLAEALENAGDPAGAAGAARAALARDDATRAAGHRDRVLPDAVRARMERLAAGRRGSETLRRPAADGPAGRP